MSSRPVYALLIGVAVLASLCRCSSPVASSGTEGGGGTEIVAVRGRVLYPDAEPAVSIVVALRPADFLPLEDTMSDGEQRAVTDETGRFSFDAPASRDYTLEAIHDTGLGFFKRIHALSEDLAEIDCGDMSLAPHGELDVKVRTDNIDSSLRLSAAIYGSGRRVVSKNGRMRFSDLPPNVSGQSYSIHLTSSDPSKTGSEVLTASVSSGAETYIREVSLPVDYRTDSVAVAAFLNNQGISHLRSFESFASGSRNRIRVLNLSECGIESLHSSIGSLDFLYTLDLTGNPIADLPSGLANAGLYNLTLDRTGISSLPAVILNCRNLALLSLNKTGVKDLPDELKNVPSLSHLSLDGNTMGRIPPVIFAISSLEALSLRSNALDSLDARIGRLINLHKLYISSNVIRALPESLAQCSKLVKLEANFNKIVELPSSFCTLNNLETLYMQDNPIAVLPDCFGNLQTLSSIDLSGCRLSSLPSSIINLTPDQLNINGNSLCRDGLPSALADYLSSYSADPQWSDTQEGCN